MRRLLPVLLALALAALALPAAGESGRLMADSADYSGDAVQAGALALLFLASQEAGATPWIAIDAAEMDVVTYSSRHANTVGAAGIGGATAPRGETERGELSFPASMTRLSGFQPDFEAHIFTLGGALAYEARSTGGQMSSLGPVRMWEGSLGDEVPPTASTDPMDSASFATIERPGPLVVHEGKAQRTEVTLRGDFVLEVHGLTLDVESPSGTSQVQTGTWLVPLEGAPEPTMAVAWERQTIFARIFLSGAELTLAVDGGTPEVAWAAVDLAMQANGPVTFSHTTGRIRLDGQEEADLQDDRFVLPAGNLLAVAPQSEGLLVDVSEPDVGPRGTIAEVPAPASAALVGAGAVLALVVAVGIGFLRRFLRTPVLADVESAIEEGEYRKAARLAGRILSRRPADESALLARGIALAKAGDNDRAVREISHHLSHSPVSDGSLHYVLGLAHLDLGRQEEGRAALREAVRLTPALQAEVGARLGKAFSLPTTTTKETSAYA